MSVFGAGPNRPKHRQTWAEIDLGRLKENFRQLRSLLPSGVFFCPMVKANAYGHGDVGTVKALREIGAEHLGVSLIEEGLRLRQNGDRGQLLVFGVFEGSESARVVIEQGLTPVVSEWQQLDAIASALKDHPGSSRFKIHLKMNTGMNRLGFATEQAPLLRDWIDQNPRIELEGIATHLLRGDDAGAPGGESESQFQLFDQALRSFAGLNVSPHILNSSGMMNLWNRIQKQKPLSTGVNWPTGARPGIGLYGIAPSNDEEINIGLRPALKLLSHLVEVRKVKAGDRVSYSATWRAKRDSTIGVVPAGYADGIWRAVSNRGSVLCRGERAPIAGTVCMDFFMIDLTDLTACAPIERGEEIVIIGEQGGASLSATELGSIAGTISYEILTRITERVPRIYV